MTSEIGKTLHNDEAGDLHFPFREAVFRGNGV
jgi:hypothetical protein